MQRLVLMLASLVLALPVVGSAPVGERTSAPPVPLLWKACDRDNCLYLLGSFHLLKKSDYPLSPDVERAFGAAESLVFEVAPEDLDDPGVAGRMLALATSDPASTLARVVPEDLRAPLDRRLRAFGLPPEQASAMEPWFVETMLVTLLGQRAGYTPDDGLDRHLMARAKAGGKPATGLETVTEQLTALDATPIHEQVAGLRDFVEEDDAAERLDELHAAWRAADLATLQRLIREEMRERAPETYRRLNVDRNRAWLPKLDAMLAQGPGHDRLVVVGALHLLGDDGVVEGLRARGHRVERICSACPAGSAR